MELKKKHSSRSVGEVDMGSHIGENLRTKQGADWQSSYPIPHLHVDKQVGTTGEWDGPCNPGLQCGEIKLQNLSLKIPVGVEVAGETPSLTGEFIGETHRVLECTHTHPPKNQHQEGPICLWVAGEVTESQLRAQQVALFPLRTIPQRQHHNPATCYVTKAHHNYITQDER